MADIKKILLPGMSEAYDIVDAGARSLISQLEAYSDYLGVTTTELVDNVTTSPNVVIAGETVEAKKGNIVNYGSAEFIYTGTVWQKFGDLSALGDLAYEDTASGSYTPAGTMTDPTVTIGGTATAAAQTVTIGGTASAAAQSASVGGTASAAAQTATVGGTASAAAQSISLTSSDVSIPNVTAVGSMPTYEVDANGVLTITAGATPTLGTAISVHDVTAATAQASSVDLTSVTVTNQASSVDLTSVTVTNSASSVDLASVTATAQASDVNLSSVTATASGTAFAGTPATIVVGVPSV